MELFLASYLYWSFNNQRAAIENGVGLFSRYTTKECLCNIYTCIGESRVGIQKCWLPRFFFFNNFTETCYHTINPFQLCDSMIFFSKFSKLCNYDKSVLEYFHHLNMIPYAHLLLIPIPSLFLASPGNH